MKEEEAHPNRLDVFEERRNNREEDGGKKKRSSRAQTLQITLERREDSGVKSLSLSLSLSRSNLWIEDDDAIDDSLLKRKRNRTTGWMKRRKAKERKEEENSCQNQMLAPARSLCLSSHRIGKEK